MTKSSRRSGGEGPTTSTQRSSQRSATPQRAGRRERARPAPERPFLERYRRPILGIAAVAAIAIVGAFVFVNATQPAYACSAMFQPTATAAPGQLGVIQDDLGRNHVQPGSIVRYPLCPPASGPHVNANGQGPIQARLYGPNDAALPMGWIHNLEHGALILLYRCDGSDACTDAGQTALQQFASSFPASPVCNVPAGSIGPVIARFDQMPRPYAALVWGRVLYLDSLDTTTILKFFQTYGERTNPEPQCPSPSPGSSPGVSPSPGPAASPSSQPSPSPS